MHGHNYVVYVYTMELIGQAVYPIHRSLCLLFKGNVNIHVA